MKIACNELDQKNEKRGHPYLLIYKNIIAILFKNNLIQRFAVIK